MLDHTKDSAGLQDTIDFADRGVGIGDAAQGHGAHHRVESVVRHRQCFRGHHPGIDETRGGLNAFLGAGSHAGVRIRRGKLSDTGWVKCKIDPRAKADFKHLAFDFR